MKSKTKMLKLLICVSQPVTGRRLKCSFIDFIAFECFFADSQIKSSLNVSCLNVVQQFIFLCICICLSSKFVCVCVCRYFYVYKLLNEQVVVNRK